MGVPVCAAGRSRCDSSGGWGLRPHLPGLGGALLGAGVGGGWEEGSPPRLRKEVGPIGLGVFSFGLLAEELGSPRVTESSFWKEAASLSGVFGSVNSVGAFCGSVCRTAPWRDLPSLPGDAGGCSSLSRGTWSWGFT